MRIPDLAQAGIRLSNVDPRSLEHIVDHAGHGLYHAAEVLLRRDSTPTDCEPGDTRSQCQKPTSPINDQLLAIILGVLLPLICAVFVLIYLHQKYLSKQRAEDLNDPHKSLDFGLGVSNLRDGQRDAPEMTSADFDMEDRARRGISMDMTVSSPYLLPAEVNDSRGSLHSMSRSVRDEHDPYRPVNLMHSSSHDGDSMRSARPRLMDDKGSLYSTTTEKAGLIAHARPMSHSIPRLTELHSPRDSGSSDDLRSPDQSRPPSRKASVSEKQLPEIIETAPPPPEPLSIPELHLPTDPPTRHSSTAPAPPRKDSISSEAGNQNRRSSYYGEEDAFDFTGTGITINEPEPDLHEQPYDIDPGMILTGQARPSLMSTAPVSPQPYDIDPGMILTGEARPSLISLAPAPSPSLPAPTPAPEHGQRLSVMAAGNRLSVMGVRPLPPDVPDDNPEMRANRIRSFYREYFDDSKPNPEGHFEEDEYDFWDGAIYDPDSGGFFVPGGPESRPFAQGPARRAMTPPPRGPPRSSNGSNRMHTRKFSTYSTGRVGPRGRPAMPKQKLPPPKPLYGLPTPYLLKNDSEILGSIDFAPPTSFRQLQNGMRPDTPQGAQRAFSPSVRAWTPLQSSFHTLTAMPSPHELRKSSTFTALDFAPPPMIRDPGSSGSDSGSIRSNRSGISAMHLDAVRAGAYRVSRIPRNMVTTREDLVTQLRPTLDMVSPA